MKTCTGCGETKDETEFNYKNKAEGIRHSRCRNCMGVYGRQYYRRNRQAHLSLDQARQAQLYRKWLYGYMDGRRCADCGNRDIAALKFVRLNGDGVLRTELLVRRGGSLEEVQNSADECEIVCDSCIALRRREHAGPWIEIKDHQQVLVTQLAE